MLTWIIGILSFAAGVWETAEWWQDWRKAGRNWDRAAKKSAAKAAVGFTVAALTFVSLFVDHRDNLKKERQEQVAAADAAAVKKNVGGVQRALAHRVDALTPAVENQLIATLSTLPPNSVHVELYHATAESTMLCDRLQDVLHRAGCLLDAVQQDGSAPMRLGLIVIHPGEQPTPTATKLAEALTAAHLDATLVPESEAIGAWQPRWLAQLYVYPKKAPPN